MPIKGILKRPGSRSRPILSKVPRAPYPFLGGRYGVSTITMADCSVERAWTLQRLRLQRRLLGINMPSPRTVGVHSLGQRGHACNIGSQRDRQPRTQSLGRGRIEVREPRRTERSPLPCGLPKDRTRSRFRARYDRAPGGTGGSLGKELGGFAARVAGRSGGFGSRPQSDCHGRGQREIRAGPDRKNTKTGDHSCKGTPLDAKETVKKCLRRREKKSKKSKKKKGKKEARQEQRQRERQQPRKREQQKQLRRDHRLGRLGAPIQRRAQSEEVGKDDTRYSYTAPIDIGLRSRSVATKGHFGGHGHDDAARESHRAGASRIGIASGPEFRASSPRPGGVRERVSARIEGSTRRKGDGKKGDGKNHEGGGKANPGGCPESRPDKAPLERAERGSRPPQQVVLGNSAVQTSWAKPQQTVAGTWARKVSKMFLFRGLVFEHCGFTVGRMRLWFQWFGERLLQWRRSIYGREKTRESISFPSAPAQLTNMAKFCEQERWCQNVVVFGCLWAELSQRRVSLSHVKSESDSVAERNPRVP